jgi:hypothetical protein
MKILLKICNEYPKKWALELNIEKCTFIVFGNKKLNNTNFILNGLTLSHTSSIKYLGIKFQDNLNFSDFLINKFSCVSKSFYSLNSFGFKPDGVNPFHNHSFINLSAYLVFCMA